LSLSEKQLAAAHRRDQDVCVVAGPGSGKTSVLIERFVWLVREQGVLPAQILAITFTERAANQIKTRLVTAFANEPELREAIERAYVSTIHGFCARLLREHAIAAGLDPQFTVMQAGDAMRLLRGSVEATLEAEYQARPEGVRRLLGAVGVPLFADEIDLAGAIVELYEKIRIAGYVPGELDWAPLPEESTRTLLGHLEQVAADDPRCNTGGQREAHEKFREWASELMEPLRRGRLCQLSLPKLGKLRLVQGSLTALLRPELERLCKDVQASMVGMFYGAQRELLRAILHGTHQRYARAKRAASQVDFADLEWFALTLLRGDPVLRDSIQQRFEFILMDELQDTNPLQWELVEELRSPGSFFGVGDSNQSIYRFRHANPQLFHDYRAQLERAHEVVDELHDNFRSRPEIIQCVNRVFQSVPDGIDPHELKAKLKYPEKVDPSVELLVGLANAENSAEDVESAWVARRIVELTQTFWLTEPGKEGAVEFRDIAILGRTNKMLDEYQIALDAAGVPSVLLGGLYFFESPEVQDVLQLLRVLANAHDDHAVAAVLRSPFARLSDDLLLRLREQAGNGPFASALVHAVALGGDEEAQRAMAFWASVEKARQDLPITGPAAALRSLLDQTGHEQQLAPRKRANVEKLLDRVRVRWENCGGSLRELVQDLEAAEPEPEAPPSDAGNAVRLLTIHGSKGLEFPIVFLPGLQRGGNNQSDVLLFEPPDQFGVTWRDPAGGEKSVSDSFHRSLGERERQRRAEEDNRLLYVAMTRAREHLVLSCALRKGDLNWADAIFNKAYGLDLKHDMPATNEVELRDGVRLLVTDRIPPRALQSSEQKDESFRIAAPPQLAEAWDSSATVTSVSHFEACPRRYLLSRYVRWPEQGQLEDHIENEPDLDEVDLVRVKLNSAELGVQVHAILSGLPVESPEPEALELASRFRMSRLGKALVKALRFEHEWDFLFEVDGLVLRGQVDLWFIQPDGRLVVCDYKTDRVSSPVGPETTRSYELQLQIYAMALEAALGKRVDEAWLHFLRPNELVPVDLSPIALGAARESVSRFRLAQSVWQFPTRPAKHCFRCEHFKALCPARPGSN
jgi:ATP-dependent helicase/nuclease subunit A